MACKSNSLSVLRTDMNLAMLKETTLFGLCSNHMTSISLFLPVDAWVYTYGYAK